MFGSLILLQFLLKPGTGSSRNSFKTTHSPPFCVFFYTHLWGVFNKQAESTAFYATACSYATMRSTPTANGTTLPLPPDLTPGDDGSERRTFKTNSDPDKSTPVQQGLDE